MKNENQINVLCMIDHPELSFLGFAKIAQRKGLEYLLEAIDECGNRHEVMACNEEDLFSVFTYFAVCELYTGVKTVAEVLEEDSEIDMDEDFDFRLN